MLFDFLFERGLITERLAVSADSLEAGAALRNRHLTDEGYYFLQRFLPRWQRRLYKYTTEIKERGFLKKWYAQFGENWPGKPLKADAPKRRVS